MKDMTEEINSTSDNGTHKKTFHTHTSLSSTATENEITSNLNKYFLFISLARLRRENLLLFFHKKKRYIGIINFDWFVDEFPWVWEKKGRGKGKRKKKKYYFSIDWLTVAELLMNSALYLVKKNKQTDKGSLCTLEYTSQIVNKKQKTSPASELWEIYVCSIC